MDQGAGQSSAFLLGFQSDGRRCGADRHMDYCFNLDIGANFYADCDCVILDDCAVKIGNDCMLGSRVQIYAATHPVEPELRNRELTKGCPVTIGNNVSIGCVSIVNPGVTLGNNVVVAPKSVVTKSFPDNVVIAGNPAKTIRYI